MEASDNKSKHISNGVKSILLTPHITSTWATQSSQLCAGLIGIILVMVLVGCATKGSSSSGDFTIVNNTKYTLNINHQRPNEGWIPLTSILAGRSWTGNRPSGSRCWYAYDFGGNINRYVIDPISPWIIQ